MEKYGIYHIFFGIFIYLPVLLINSTSAFIAVFFFYFGRERRDYEIKAEIPVRKWYLGWNIFKWAKEDLFPVTVFYAAISTVLVWSKLWV